MKKCIVIPDSFKGTMSSGKICIVAEDTIKRIFPQCEIISIPVADGGEGTVDCFLKAMHGEKISISIHGPYLEPVTAYYGLFNRFAVIETAQAAGLPMVENRQNPAKTTTYGVGEMILDAVTRGAREIYLGLGGSCTNDGGCGAAAALGVKFIDAEGNEFTPTGETLTKIHTINKEEAKVILNDCKIIAMCDVENPLYGMHGAAYTFAPQKGANKAMVEELDNQLRYLAEKVKELHGEDSIPHVPGAGAAGGFGAGVIAFLGGQLKPGIETILDILSFDKLVKDADAVFTGEGRIDGQSIKGKAVIGIAKRCKSANVPLYAIVGDIEEDARKAYDMGVTAMFTINRTAGEYETIRHKSEENFRATLEDVLRLMRAK